MGLEFPGEDLSIACAVQLGHTSTCTEGTPVYTQLGAMGHARICMAGSCPHMPGMQAFVSLS